MYLGICEFSFLVSSAFLVWRLLLQPWNAFNNLIMLKSNLSKIASKHHHEYHTAADSQH